MSTLPLGATASLPTVDQATEPAAIRHGGKAAQNAYQTGLAFEQMLVNQLTTAMTKTISPDGSDGLGGSADDGSGVSGGTDPAASTYSSMLPGALTSGLMAGGGSGVAMQVARSLDPALLSGDRSTGGGSTGGRS